MKTIALNFLLKISLSFHLLRYTILDHAYSGKFEFIFEKPVEEVIKSKILPIILFRVRPFDVKDPNDTFFYSEMLRIRRKASRALFTGNTWPHLTYETV